MRGRLVSLAALVWLTAVVTGLAWVANYDNKPGAAPHAPPRWPTGSRMALDPHHPTLMMLAHPRCDCTRASLDELAELLARADERPRTFVVFIRPPGVPANWERTPLWDQATRITGVTVLSDDEGREARRFGVETSGQTLLYGVDGRLLFAGGTTGSRGHRGDNLGRASIIELLNGAPPDRSATPAFGCDLFGSTVEHDISATTQGQHGA